MPNENDIHGMKEVPGTRSRTAVQRADNKSYNVRDFIKAMMDTEDLDADVTFSFANSDPLPVTNIDFEEGQVVIKGDV